MAEKRMYLVYVRWLGTGREGHMIVLAESRDDAKAKMRETAAQHGCRPNFLTLARRGQVIVL